MNDLNQIETWDAQDLRVALALQAFLPVEPWDRWDSGDVGYSLYIKGSREIFVRLTWDRECPGYWVWDIREGDSSHRITASKSAYKLAYRAMQDALLELRKIEPDYEVGGGDDG